MYDTDVTPEDEHPRQPLTKAELRARFIGDALKRDAEEILFWRDASDTLRGRTLYRLLARGRAIRAAVPHQTEDEQDSVRLVLTPGHARIINRDE